MDLLCKSESLEMLDAILGIENGKDDFPKAFLTAIDNIPNSCGIGLTWALEEEKNSTGAATSNYILSINGTGETYNWASYEKTPWAKTGNAPITKLELGDNVLQLGKNLIESNSTSVKLGSNYTALHSSNFEEAYNKNGAIIIDCDSIEHLLSLDRLPVSGVQSSDKVLWINPRINGEPVTSIEVPSNMTDLGPLSLSNLKGVTSISVPEGLKTGLESALYFTEDLELLTIAEKNPSYSVRRVITNGTDGNDKTRYIQLTDKEGKTLLKMYGASDGEYSILGTVTSIDEDAFNVFTATSGWKDKDFALTIYGTNKIPAPGTIITTDTTTTDTTNTTTDTTTTTDTATDEEAMMDRFKQFFGFEPITDATTTTNHKLKVATGMKDYYTGNSFWKYFGVSNIEEISKEV